MSRNFRLRYRTRVVRYDPRVRAALAVVAALFAVVMLLAAYFAGQDSADIAPRTEAYTALEFDASTAVDRQKEAVSQELANLRRGAEIDRKASEQFRAEMAQARAEIVRLRRDVSIYQSLLDNSVKTRGVSVYAFEARALGNSSFEFRITFLQRNANSGRVRGRASFQLLGISDGKPMSLSSDDLNLGAEGLGQFPINFIYFQVVEGAFELPKTFNPNQVKVSVRLDGRRGQRIEQTVDWPEKE